MTKIITDSAANISQAETKEMELKVLPFPITFEDEEFLDDINISIDEFYNKLTSTKIFPKTSQLSMEDLENVFEEAKQNNEKVLLILLSSALSGTYNTANMLKRDGGYDNVYIYDSKGATTLNRILVDVALRNKDKEPEEIIKILDEVRSKINLIAAVDTLEYLKRGGRLSAAKAAIGGLLSLKPILTINESGSLEVKGKAIGFNNAIKNIVTMVEKEGGIDTDYPVYFLYSMTDANCQKLQKQFENVGIKEYKTINLCSVIGCHVGPGVAGITFVKKV